MKRFFLFIALLTLTNAFAQVKQTVTKSTVSYEIKNMGINTSGKFTSLQADIKFDPQQLATSSIEASIETASLNSENDMRDKHLKSEDYFDIVKYPHITMKSVSFKHGSGNNYTGVFNVTIKDKTKTVNVPFTYTETGSNASLFKGSFKIDRTDFGVGGSSMVLAKEATINIEVETTK
ncbi:YceI family protein [Mucilaginibacter agri]|uniref:Polyisoprenoid-binding protein n=1 Tax=Mucilaginibacter agri TaxID=2695265 RepID=A0A965ZCS9_9SPHI|nr:YceI family protein [Mucilaginibacter agri]NCD68643.1 polyisoprenoid-binding protein [Mucilaginibacter agri]